MREDKESNKGGAREGERGGRRDEGKGEAIRERKFRLQGKAGEWGV